MAKVAGARARSRGSKEPSARGAKRTAAPVTRPPLVLELYAPGMTPLLRAGLGGLASALRFVLLEEDLAAGWPSPVTLAGGQATVEARRIILDWGAANPSDVLAALFAKTFRISKAGIITLAGTFEPDAPPTRPLAIALQNGWKRTFLQHGKSTGKQGELRTATDEVDAHRFTFEWQPYRQFAHQGAWKDIGEALSRDRMLDLAGWAYPGAAQRHRYAETRCEYSAGQALAACFALVGCLSFDVRPARMGALVIPEPSELVAFASARPGLTPKQPAAAFVSSLGDAVLQTELALRMDNVGRRRGIAAMHGVLLKTLPWASQQKTRSRTLDLVSVAPATLDAFDDVVHALPARLRATPHDDDDSESGYFVATSALRAFIADNVAAGKPWYAGFATATVGGKKARSLHYFRDGDNLGALYPEEKKGLVIMSEHLDEAEHALVRSVQTALRQRFGRISEETHGLPKATRDNRFTSERERWRLAFAGAKTHEQIRAALANLWSMAGPNRELRESWEQIMPLLRPKLWQAARDLALVALASYQGASREEDGDTTTENSASSDGKEESQ